jgi:hypothetical protein
MSHSKHAAFARRDSNHDELVAVYESLHCGVIDTHAMGFGMPDILVHFSGYCCPVEIKSEDGQLEPSQQRFFRDWKGPKIEVVRSADDVVQHVTRIRHAQATGARL